MLNEMNVAANSRATPIPDIQGSVIGSLDAASGALFQAGYLPFGENTATTTGRFRFTGRRQDANTASRAQPSGLYYYRARMYAPDLGRFLQPDPIGYAGGLNVYGYVGNDPLNLVDPLGLRTLNMQLGGGLVGLVGATAGGGLYITNDGAFGFPDIGVFKQIGPAVGANGGVGLSFGYTYGSVTNFQGRALAVDVSAGPVTVSGSFGPTGTPSGTFSNPIGLQLGVAVGSPIGADISAPKTTTFGLIDNVIVPAVQSVWTSLTGQSPQVSPTNVVNQNLQGKPHP